MNAYVIVATKGRAKQTYVLLDYLMAQTLPPASVIVVGSERADIEGLDRHPSSISGNCVQMISEVGLTRQRNTGLRWLSGATATMPETAWYVAFFDDDFRPAPNWLEHAAKALKLDPTVAGVTGNVLADGVKSEFGIDEQDAVRYLTGRLSPQQHWSSASENTPVVGLYGCNMAFSGLVAKALTFDEQLPLYGWQEDYDFSSRSRAFGKTLLVPACVGVHLGSSSGRTSGVKFGYSQVSNPLYLVRKGSMRKVAAFRLMVKNMAANLIKTLLMDKKKDFPGRLRGNYLAIRDLIVGKLNPANVLALK